MNIILSNASNDPIYVQITQQIRSLILSGTLGPGQPLPSIRQLAKDLQISVITTKRAYEELEKEGLIDSVVGKGSFVAGINADFVREQRMKRLEQQMLAVIKEGKALRLSLSEIQQHMQLLYEEGDFDT
ncbi:GntR family transcriptional regulator [Paenibacillus algorifonticola]|uniref:GntR family transcriptional regulator n=1 Tax=Paenibacillus algorifonticola TaxID=684063 RepID=UPI003D26B1F0